MRDAFAMIARYWVASASFALISPLRGQLPPEGGSLSIEFKVIYMTTTMNRLPVSTWNPLGVNYAPASAALPAVPAAGWAKAEALSPALPAGVTAPAAADFGSFAASGMGGRDRRLAGRKRQPCQPSGRDRHRRRARRVETRSTPTTPTH